MIYLRFIISVFIISTFASCSWIPHFLITNQTNKVVELHIQLKPDTLGNEASNFVWRDYFTDYTWTNQNATKDSAKIEWRTPTLGIIYLQPQSTTLPKTLGRGYAIKHATINYDNGHVDTLNKNLKYTVFSKRGKKRSYAREFSQDFMVYDIKSKQSQKPKKENSQLIQMDTIALYQLVQTLHLDNKESNTYYPLNHLGNFDFTSLTKADHEMLLILLEQNNVASRYVHSLLSSQSSINCDATISDHFTYFMKCYMTNEKYPGNQVIICPDYSKGQAFKEEIKKWLQYKIETWE